ncbi:MAG TPA: DMT family transporter [Gemmatimonadaceae bacterium]|nr:DMT family transporter [Gemmatimonadaceae bacterium]
MTTATQATTPDTAHPLRGTLLVLISAACFGTTLIFTQRALDGGATLSALLAYRYVLGTLMLGAVAGGPVPVLAVGDRKWRLLLIGGAAQTAIAGLSVASLGFIPAASVAFLFYTYPTWVAVLAIVRRTEPVDGRKIAALMLSLAGIVTIVGNPLATKLDPRGIGLALAAAAIYALMIPWLGKIQEGLKPAPAMTWIALGAAACFIAGALITGTPLFPASATLLINAGALALIATTLAFTTFLAGLAALGPVRTSIVSTVEPFWTALLAGLVLGQDVGPRTWIGGAMIAAAMVVLQWKPSADR